MRRVEQRHSDGRKGGRREGKGGNPTGRAEGGGEGGRMEASSVRRVDQEIAQEEESPPFIFYPALALLPLPSLPYPIPAGFGKLSTPREPIKVSKLIPSVSFNGLDP